MTRRARRLWRVIVNREARRSAQILGQRWKAIHAKDGAALITFERTANWGMVQCCRGCRRALRKGNT